MKKFSILSFLFLSGLISFAQNANHVRLKGFEEKTEATQHSKGQTDSLKQEKTALHETTTTLQSKVNEQTSYIENDKAIMYMQADSIKTMNKKIAAIEHDYINKSNNLLALIVGIFIFLVFIFLYFTNALKRKDNEFIKYINETNNILLEQGQAKDKEMTRIVVDLNNTNESIKEIKGLINKSIQKK
jgi:hypothetical protein